jgi:small subunit ribosomal protein S2
MRRFIFAERNGIHIIDLQKTLRQLELAQNLAREVVSRGDNVLFVCTKRQLSAIVRAEAERSGSMYVTERWLGGLLTNFQTVKKQTRRLEELEKGTTGDSSDFAGYTKKEQLLLARQRDKLAKNLSGIKTMRRLPGLIFIVDSKKERIAVEEANKLGIPLIAITDTNADPDLITVPIAGNDDAIRSVELIARAIADTIAEARLAAPARRDEEDAEMTTYSSDRGAEGAPRGDRGPGGAPAGGGAPAAGGGGSEDDRKRRPRRRRARPDAIDRLRAGGTGAEGGEAGEAGEAATEGSAPAAE